MTDKKLTDSEIVKGLEICSNNGDCKECPINPHHGNYGYCTSLAIKAALDLINRLQAKLDEAEDTIQFAYKELKKSEAEIERLTARNFELAEKGEKVVIAFKNAKAEAYKEFATKTTDKVEKVKQKYERLCKEQGEKMEEHMHIHFNGIIKIVKDLLNELVGEQLPLNDVKCKDCEYLELELPYAVCSKAYKGIVAPNDSCGKGKTNELVGNPPYIDKQN